MLVHSKASLVSISKRSALITHTAAPFRTLWYHAYSLWLFAFNDLKTTVIPKTAFGIITFLAGPILTRCPRPGALTFVHCLPLITTWIWLNLLPLTMKNQAGEDDLKEDTKNKTKRPIPAGRLTIDETKRLLLASYAAAILASACFGRLPECLAITLQGWIYNDLGAANDNYLARNILNASGHMTFAVGAAKVACIQPGTELQEGAYLWFGLLGAVIVTTIQFQDLYDQSGDSARGRRSLPLVVGDGIARFSVALPIAVWSIICPAFWRLEGRFFILPLALGAFIIFRLFHYRSVSADKTSFRLWNAWVVVLYTLPFLEAIE